MWKFSCDIDSYATFFFFKGSAANFFNEQSNPELDHKVKKGSRSILCSRYDVSFFGNEVFI